MSPHPAIFSRAELMLGSRSLDAISGVRVAIFGLGGVGSWCAESLVRTGVRQLMLVDSDRVSVTNVNRQLMATTRTVGQVKVDVLAARLREINPDVVLDVRPAVYCAATAPGFNLAKWDYVIDAIDSLENKALLIRNALSFPSVTLFASMGAALKMDPFQIRHGEFSKVAGDPLARALRQKLRRTGGMPGRPFECVWSPERRENLGNAAADAAGQCESGEGQGDPASAGRGWDSLKARINGTVAHTTAIFGFALASLVISDIERRARQSAG